MLKPAIAFTYNQGVAAEKYIERVAIASLRTLVGKNVEEKDIQVCSQNIVQSKEWKNLLQSEIPSWSFEFQMKGKGRSSRLLSIKLSPAGLKLDRYIKDTNNREGELDFAHAALAYCVYLNPHSKTVIIRGNFSLEMLKVPRKRLPHLIFSHLVLYYKPEESYFIVLQVLKNNLLGVAVVCSNRMTIHYFDSVHKKTVERVAKEFQDQLGSYNFAVSYELFESESKIDISIAVNDIRADFIAQFIFETTNISSIKSLVEKDLKSRLSKNVISFYHSNPKKDRDEVRRNAKHLELGKLFNVVDFGINSFEDVQMYLCSNALSSKYKVLRPIQLLLHAMAVSKNLDIKFLTLARVFTAEMMENSNGDTTSILMNIMESMVKNVASDDATVNDFKIVIFDGDRQGYKELFNVDMYMLLAFHAEATGSTYIKTTSQYKKIEFTSHVAAVFKDEIIVDNIEENDFGISYIQRGCVSVFEKKIVQQSSSDAHSTVEDTSSLITSSLIDVHSSSEVHNSLSPFREVEDILPKDEEVSSFNYTVEEDEAIRDALSCDGNEDDLVRELGPILLSRKTMRRLRDEGWLNEEIIEIYLKDFSSASPKSSSFYICSTSMTCALSKEGHYAYTTACKVDRDVEMSSRDRLGFIMNENNIHWFAIVVYLKAKTLLFLDSLYKKNSGRSKKFKPVILKYLANRNDDLNCVDYGKFSNTSEDWKVDWHPSCPQQNNSSDCGVMAIKFLEAALCVSTPGDVQFNFSHENIPAFRKQICHKLLSTAVTIQSAIPKKREVNSNNEKAIKGMCQFAY